MIDKRGNRKVDAAKPLVLWIATNEASEPYLHKLTDDCDCKTCESKKSRIVKPQ